TNTLPLGRQTPPASCLSSGSSLLVLVSYSLGTMESGMNLTLCLAGKSATAALPTLPRPYGQPRRSDGHHHTQVLASVGRTCDRRHRPLCCLCAALSRIARAFYDGLMLDATIRDLAHSANFAAFTVLLSSGQPMTNIMWVDATDEHVV